ncbi:hypothetical protein ACI2IX_11065 [Leifsonia aquatica]|uniref:hypothetical protein n=1 Tax=Leifsonia aquatica TaxID=144185 RepID=UPI00384C897D
MSNQSVEHDVVFLSYDEPHAEQNFERCRDVLGPAVKRLHGVSGMHRAYRLTAELVDTDRYLVIDGDLYLDERFRQLATVAAPEDVVMVTWAARNSVNGLCYGYGGPKLVRRSAMTVESTTLDVLAGLPGRKIFRADVAGETRIDGSWFQAWRAAFREVAMLTIGSEYGMPGELARERVQQWATFESSSDDSPTAVGARDALVWLQQRADHDEQRRFLNDPRKLRAHFLGRGHKDV